MMYKQGDILLIPIPFSDLTSSKRRPVLVLSNSEYNKTTDDLVVAAITSNLKDRGYTILFTNNDLEVGNLKVDSCIRTDKIYTLSKSIVIKRFGSVKPEVLASVKDKIRDLLEDK